MADALCATLHACRSHDAGAGPSGTREAAVRPTLAGPGYRVGLSARAPAGAAAGHLPLLQQQAGAGRRAGARAVHRAHVRHARRGGAADLARGLHAQARMGAPLAAPARMPQGLTRCIQAR